MPGAGEGAMTANHDRAAELYAAWSLLEEPRPLTATLGVRELYLFLTDPAYRLTAAQWAKLHQTPRLLQAFNQFKEELKVVSMPVLAAAFSPGEEVERRFPGGTVWAVPSRGHEQQVNFAAAFDDHVWRPNALKLIGTDGTAASLPLEPPEDGYVQIPLDLANEDNRMIVRLLADPGTTGVFV